MANGTWDGAAAAAAALSRSLLTPVVNATGVLLHTNLGRAPWPATDPGRATNLELDLDTGRRGDRRRGVGRLLATLTGAEDALVLNNGAAAVLLVLAALAEDRDTVVSRGELVEIGGGFRIPDVVARSGTRLVEVGTTNRTRADDYRRAVAAPGADVGAILVVHRSNFRIEGFTASPTVTELATIGPPVVVDLGSGLLDAGCPWLRGGPPAWLAGEPGVRQTLAAGADLVAFSGDKLLAGPQAGIVVGRADLVARCAAHPLARALRCGSLVLGSLQELALTYLRRDGEAVPFWRRATTPLVDLEDRARAVVARAGRGEVAVTEATTGGGTLPGVSIPSIGVALEGDHLAVLRAAPTPVIARVRDGRTLLDLRTVDPHEDGALAEAVGGTRHP